MARGDIFVVHLPAPRGTSGREQIGTRPAVVVQTDISDADLPTTIVVPITSRLKALRFPHTIKIECSPENGLQTESVLLVFQLRAIDRSRLVRKMGTLESHYVAQLEAELKALLSL